MATITFQNLFRLYKKLAGMTGTADTEAAEFHSTYKLDVVVIPTNRPIVRDGLRRRRLQDRAREVHAPSSTRSSTVTNEASRCSSARRASRRSAAIAKILQKKGDPAQRPQREAPRERGAGRRAGGPQGRHHRLDQHGRPRHRHHPRRQRRDDGQDRVSRRTTASRMPSPKSSRSSSRSTRRSARPSATEVVELRRSAHPRHRAPRVAPHRQPAPRPRRPPGRPWLVHASTCRSKTT